MDTIAANKTLARRFLDLVAEHDVDALCAVVSPTWRMHGGPPALPAGPEGAVSYTHLTLPTILRV